jgi:hypothetical protein
MQWLAEWNRREGVPPGAQLSAAGGAGGKQAADGDAAGAPGGASSSGKDGAPAAPPDWRLLLTQPLLRRALLVSSGLAGVCAVVFFVAGLACDALQVGRGRGGAGRGARRALFCLHAMAGRLV